MFEDSLIDSGGRLKTKSKYWMIGTAILNFAILTVMIIIPLMYPEALPKTAMTAMLTAPPPPPPLLCYSSQLLIDRFRLTKSITPVNSKANPKPIRKPDRKSVV